MKLMPLSKRLRTTSLASILLIGKCLPTSRRNSMADIGPVQSRLLTIRAATGPVNSKNGSTWPRMRSTHPATTAGSLSVRSPLSLGSPMSPVAPPTSNNGL